MVVKTTVIESPEAKVPLFTTALLNVVVVFAGLNTEPETVTGFKLKSISDTLKFFKLTDTVVLPQLLVVGLTKLLIPKSISLILISNTSDDGDVAPKS